MKRARAKSTLRVAVVTGSGGTIGGAVAARLKERGFHVVGLDVRESSRRVSTFIRTDLKNEASVSEARDQVVRELGSVAVLVHCAGRFRPRSLMMGSEQMFLEAMNVDLLAAYRCLRAFVPVMERGGGGRIIHVASIAGMRGVSGAAAYCASKAALISLTQTAALELAPRNIQVLAVAPGFVTTSLSAGYAGEYLEQKRIPVGRAARPDEVAEWVEVLATTVNGYATGACLVVDGGLSLT